LEEASEGDTQEFVGTIAEKEKVELLGGYIYKFEGCESGFFGSSSDLEEGEYAYLEITIHDSIPQVNSKLSYIICGVPGAICSGIMLILLIVSIILFAMGKKQDKMAPKQPTQDLSQATAVLQQVQAQEQMYQQQQQPQYGYGAPPAGGGQRTCQRCGTPAQFYADRNVYWCGRCNQYA
jgi:hypothetical protein